MDLINVLIPDIIEVAEAAESVELRSINSLGTVALFHGVYPDFIASYRPFNEILQLNQRFGHLY